VQQHAGGVEHAAERRTLFARELGAQLFGELAERTLDLPGRRGREARAQLVERAPRLDEQALAPVDSRQRLDLRLGEQAVDGRQLPPGIERGGRARVHARILGDPSR
jgi:hypothetical protein